MDPDVEQSYHHALDVNDRMLPQNFYSSLQLLQTIFDRMKGKYKHVSPINNSNVPFINVLRQ